MAEQQDLFLDCFQKQVHLGWKCECEADVDEDEEDESKEFLAKLVVILLVGELVGVFHESVGDC